MNSSILDHQHFYLVGIKGVALTALAQCLLDAGKSVRGSDVEEEFVTQKILNQRKIQIDFSFDTPIPSETECVIYTAAHNAQQNPQVQAALEKKLTVLSHAKALGQLFNLNQGLAVCGVGGKSTTSAMITWILEKLKYRPNFAIGVGDIPGLGKTGQWSSEAKYFVAEADEYVTDPSAPSRGEEITPRFSFLNPFVTVCTNLTHDHPDVYPDFASTKKYYNRFFSQIQPGGFLIAYLADKETHDELAKERTADATKLIWFGEEQNQTDDGFTNPAFLLLPETYIAKDGQTSCRLRLPHLCQELTVTLQLPGMYNLRNAAAAIAACWSIGVSVEDAANVLKDFQSTLRRCQFVGEKNGVRYYDDYGHHPNEVASVIHAYREWFPDRRLVVGFQSHTFTRTKQFFTEFVQAFAEANEVVMIDIFPSAREAYDPNVTSDQLCLAIEKQYPQVPAHNLKTIPQLATYCRDTLKPGDVFITIGAGDIYQVHDLI
jgi:UDP-N-acetylmuramate--alanine ligase